MGKRVENLLKLLNHMNFTNPLKDITLENLNLRPTRKSLKPCCKMSVRRFCKNLSLIRNRRTSPGKIDNKAQMRSSYTIRVQ